MHCSEQLTCLALSTYHLSIYTYLYYNYRGNLVSLTELCISKYLFLV